MVSSSFIRWLTAVLAVATVATASSAHGQQLLTGEERQIVALINQSRSAAGGRPLAVDQRLSMVARAHSQDMARAWFFGHRSPTTGTVFDRLRTWRIPFRSASQNIAWASSPSEAHEMLMESPPNRANLLSPSFTHLGVGVIQTRRRLLVTENFVRAPAGARYAQPAPGRTWGESPRATALAPAPQVSATPERSRSRAPSRLDRWRRSRQPRQCTVAGVWQGTVPDGMLRGRTVSFIFRDDGTVTGRAGSVTLHSRWSLQQNVVTIVDVSATPSLAACPSGRVGRYVIQFGAECQTVHIVSGEDSCRHRALTLRGLQATRAQ